MGVNVTKAGTLIYRDAEFEPKVSDNVPNSETGSFYWIRVFTKASVLMPRSEETIARE